MSRRRTFTWILGGLGILLLFCLVAGYLVLKSQGFHRYVLATIVRQAQESTGAGVQVRDFDFRFSTLTATLYDITLHGAESASQRPLLHVDKLTVALKVQSVLQRKVNLSELLIEHPVARLLVARDGKSNLPQPPPKRSTGNTNLFDLAVGHILVSNGEIYYNDQKQQLSADLYDLRTEIQFHPLQTRYSGYLAYDKGRVQYANYPSLPHNLRVQFAATPHRFSLDSLTLTLGSSQASLRAAVEDYSNPKVQGSYNIQIHVQDFAAMSPAVRPAGDVFLSGAIHYQKKGNGPLLRGAVLSGTIHSRGVTATASHGSFPLGKIEGDYQFAGGTFQLPNFAMELFGGQLKASIVMRHLDTTPVSQLHASLRGISLVDAKRAFRNPQLNRMPLTGTLEGDAEATWKGSASNIRVLSNIGLRAALCDSSGRPATPLDGSIHLNYDGRRKSLSLRQSSLRTPSTSVVLQGEIGDHSKLHVNTQARDLRELAVLISALRGNGAPLDVSGSARLDAVVAGSLQRPNITGQLNAQNLRVQGSQWRAAGVSFQAGPSRVALQNGSLQHAQRGSATFSGQAGLRNWAYSPSSPIAANLSVRHMSVAELLRLANQLYPITGSLSADFSLRGSQLNPVAQGNALITDAKAYDEPIQKLSLQLQSADGAVKSLLKVNLPAGSADANLTYRPKDRAYDVRLNVPAMDLQKLAVVQAKDLPVRGALTASASGAGTLDHPRLTATLQFPQLELRNAAVSRFKAQVDVVEHRATLALNAMLAQVPLQAKGTVGLNGNYYADLTLDTGRFQLDPLLAMYVANLPPEFRGETELHAALKGPLKDKSNLEAHVTVPTLRASYQALEVGNTQPIRVDYARSVVTLHPAEIRGAGTDLRLQGSVPLAGPPAMTLTAQGSVDLGLLRIFSSDLNSSGALTLDVRATGSTGNPSLQGQVRLQNVSLATSAAPLGVDKLNATVDVDSTQLKLTSLTAQVGGGNISAGGSVTYRPTLQFNLALQGRNVRLLYPQGLRSILNSNLVFVGKPQESAVQGRVLIDSLSFTPDFDLASFTTQFNGSSAPPSGESFADHVKLAVSVQSGQSLSAQSSQVSLEGQVNLQVVGTASNPVIVGRTDLTSGELFFLNNRYQLQQGVITLSNPNQTEPVLNIAANTTIQQYNLTVTLRGPIEKLNTTYTSDPPLATADIINLMARGQTTAQASAAGQSTDSILAGQAASQVTGGIQKLAGLSSLRIDPLLGGNNQNPSARVALQQRVTNNFLFTFSTDVTQPESEVIVGDYRINKRWSVNVARNQVGGVSVGAQFHTKF